MVKTHYRLDGRHDLPWRRTRVPYRIAVSELMLQQTQVPRVIEKYKTFLTLFPTVHALAAAPLSSVLAAWSGLGYNRRAKFLHDMAKEIVKKRKGAFPKTVAALESLPGVGPYTARAIAAFAYNEPVVLIETNVRSAYLHHFFPGKQGISDQALLPIIAATLDRKAPREWYAALMDYGAHLKASGNTAHRGSAAYKKQSAFIGSRRQARGAIIRALLTGAQTAAALSRAANTKDISAILSDLSKEGLVVQRRGKYSLLS